MDATPKKVEMPDGVLEHVVNPWLLGADPEFAVVQPPNTCVKNWGPNSVNLQAPAGGIGYDHSGRVWELRPAPSRSAYGVVTNMWRLLRRAEMAKVEQFKWKSGALGAVGTTPIIPTPAVAVNAAGQLEPWEPDEDDIEQTGEDTLGGHVHFGMQGLNPAQLSGLGKLTGTLLNLDVLPRKENLKRIRLAKSRGQNYGDLRYDVVRSCGDHIEFRAAPSWLDKPGQAFAALTAYKLAAVRPSSITWTDDFELKANFLEWLEDFSGVDVDAWLLSRLVDEQGFGAIQADPSADFKPRWRRDDLWAK